MSKKKYLLIAFLMFFASAFAQQQTVPYRVGDKFGVGTTNGKMIIPADYDIVAPETYNDYQYYVAYKLLATGNLSTLIYKDKIILKDQKYNNYYINHELITAVQYKVITKPIRYENDEFKETVHLYDLKGKRLFAGDFKSIAVRNDIDNAKKISTVLIYTHDLNDFESLYLYDTKAKKITKTFIENAKPIDAIFNYNDNYRDRSITNLYLDKNGVGKKMILELKDNSIIVKSDEIVNYRAEIKRNEARSGGFYDVAIPDEKPKIILNSEEEKKVLTVRKIEQKRGFYYLQKQIEELKITTLKLKESEQFIVSKDNKQGLFTVYNQTFTIPIAYDEIIFADFESRSGGYILRDGGKYGAFIYFNRETKTIKPIFDKIPLPVNINYFGEAKPLFKLYDDNGTLLCYADETGKLFYKK
jgi:hypothetical protein